GRHGSRDRPLNVGMQDLVKQFDGCRRWPILLVALAAIADGGGRVGLFEERAGSLVFAQHVRPAAVDHESAGSDCGSDLGITEAFEMVPQNAVFGLVERAVTPVEGVRDKSRFETRIEGRGVEGCEATLAGSSDADSLRINARDFAEKVYPRRDLLDLAADQVAADLICEADEPAAVF